MSEVVALNPKPSGIAVFQLHRAMDPEICHLFLGQAVKRIRQFAEKYDTGANPIVLSREFEQDFAKDTNQDFFLVIAVRDLRVVGHFLTRLEWCYGNKYVHLSQLDIVGAGLNEDEIASGLKMVKDWARSMEAVGLRLGALTDAHVRLYRRHGFSPWITVMKGGL